MALKKLVLLSLILTFIGCSNKPTITPEESYKSRIQKMSYKEVIKEIKTPEQAKKYLTEFLVYVPDSINYNTKDYIAPFKEIHKKGKDDCDGGTVSPAELLSDDGYEPLFLYMAKANPWFGIGPSHSVFVYQERGLWGCLGISKNDCIRPKFSSIDSLVENLGFFFYKLINLDECCENWTDKSIDISKEIHFNKLENISKPQKR